MTVETPIAEQQRAVVELYIQSQWIKATLTLDDDHLVLQYALNKHSSPIPNEQKLPPEALNNQKRTVKIVKADNIGLGKNEKKIKTKMICFFLQRYQYQRWTRKSNANYH